MIALTQKAAKRFKVDWSNLPHVDAGAWIVDHIKIGKGPLLVLIVHQDSLFTLIRLSADVKSLKDVAREIERVWPGFELCDGETFYKNGNRRATGSIVDMKYMMRIHMRYGEPLDKVQWRMNDCPFSAIGMDRPQKRFDEILEKR